MTNSGGESDELSDYFREIAQHSLLGPYEELELARQMLDGGCAERAQARQRLIESNLRLAVSIRSTLPRPGAEPGGSHPGGQHWPADGHRQVRLGVRLSTQHLCVLADSPGDD